MFISLHKPCEKFENVFGFNAHTRHFVMMAFGLLGILKVILKTIKLHLGPFLLYSPFSPLNVNKFH
jgi:hypothetical protein